MGIRQRLDHWIFEEYRTSVLSLALYRMIFAASVLIYVLPRYLWISGFPDTFFNPPLGFMLLFRGFPPGWFFQALFYVIVSSTLCLLVGYRTRLASAVFSACLVLGNGWAYSFGKIDHDIMYVLVPPLLALAGWGDALSIDAQSRPAAAGEAWPMALLALLVGLAVLTAAIAKVESGWLRTTTQATYGHLLHNYFVVGRRPWLASKLMGHGSPWMWELLDTATVLLEGGFILTVVKRRAFRLMCAAACCFHMGVLLLFGISFNSLPLTYAAFVDWERLAGPSSAVVAATQRALVRVRPWLVPLAAVPVAILYATVGNPFIRVSSLLFEDPVFALEAPLHVAAFAAAVVYLSLTLARAVWPTPQSLSLRP